MNLIQNGVGAGYYCPDDPGEPGGSKRISITDGEGELLSDLVRLRRVLEIGTGLGVATRYMAKTARIVYTMDVDPWVQNNVWPELDEVPFVVCITDPKDAIDVDVCFIDGRHTYDQVLRDIEIAKQAGCTTIIGHDMRTDDVKKAFRRHFGYIEMYNTKYKIGVVECHSSAEKVETS